MSAGQERTRAGAHVRAGKLACQARRSTLFVFGGSAGGIFKTYTLLKARPAEHIRQARAE